MSTITLDTTIGALVRDVPARSRVFEKLGIDYCCGGKKTLVDACHTRHLDPVTVATLLAAMDGPPGPGEVDARRLSLTELCDHIERTHHAYLRDELPRLDFLTRKVAAVHGEHEPRLLEIRQVFQAFAPEIVSHLIKEEDAVFPRIRELETTTSNRADAAADLKASLDELEQEHDDAGDALARFHALTDRYTPPEWACNTFRALYDALARLEENMHQHVHQENNVLFPRALALP
jgi:regulator of cell morphogenesis and NO signaling